MMKKRWWRKKQKEKNEWAQQLRRTKEHPLEPVLLLRCSPTFSLLRHTQEMFDERCSKSTKSEGIWKVWQERKERGCTIDFCNSQLFRRKFNSWNDLVIRQVWQLNQDNWIDVAGKEWKRFHKILEQYLIFLTFAC